MTFTREQKSYLTSITASAVSARKAVGPVLWSTTRSNQAGMSGATHCGRPESDPIVPHKALLRCALEKNTRHARVGGAEGATRFGESRLRTFEPDRVRISSPFSFRGCYEIARSLSREFTRLEI